MEQHYRVEEYESVRQSSRKKWFVAMMLSAAALLVWAVR